MTAVRASGLVQARFEIDAEDPSGIFSGWHNPEVRWNGWATPAFERVEAERVVAHVNRQREELGADSDQAYMEWRGDVAVYINPEYTLEDGREEEFGPDENGLYWIGAWSWTWSEFEGEPEGWTLADYLRVRRERAAVYAAASNESNHALIEQGVADRIAANSFAGARAMAAYDAEHGYTFATEEI